VKKFLMAFILAGLAGVAEADNDPPCSGVPSSQIPSLKNPPSLTLDVTPEVLGSSIWEGLSARFTVRASAEGYVKSAWLQVVNEMRWEDKSQTLKYWSGSPSQTVYYGPVGPDKNGTHRFRFLATVCYKLNGQVREETLFRELPVPMYLPWLITGALGNITFSQEKETTHLRKFLWKEADTANFIEWDGKLRGGSNMFIEGLGTGLAEPLRRFLADYLVEGFMNKFNRYPPGCYFLELGCYSVAPVHLRLYTAPNGVRGLFREGPVQLGAFGGQKDSRSFKLEGEAIAGVLVVRGYRRDYVLLSKKGDYSDEKVLVIEMPKGEAEIFRKVLSLAILQTKATEIRP
jgi:hypothetical protein